MVLAVAVLAGCGVAMPGDPVPAAGFGPEPREGAAPRELSDVDPCGLLRPEDLAPVGGQAAPPRPRTDPFPESCAFPLGGGADGDLVLVAFHKPLEQVRRDRPEGREERTLGYPTWLYCGVSESYRTCVAAVAVREDRTLLVGMDRRDSSEATVLRGLQPLTEKALERLPRS